MKACVTPKNYKRSQKSEQNFSLSELERFSKESMVTQTSIPQKRQISSLFHVSLDTKSSYIKQSQNDIGFVCSNNFQKTSHCNHCVIGKPYKYSSSWKDISLRQIRIKAEKYIRENMNQNLKGRQQCSCCQQENCGNVMSEINLRQFLMRYNLYKEQCQYLRQKFIDLMDKDQEWKSNNLPDKHKK